MSITDAEVGGNVVDLNVARERLCKSGSLRLKRAISESVHDITGTGFYIFPERITSSSVPYFFAALLSSGEAIILCAPDENINDGVIRAMSEGAKHELSVREFIHITHWEWSIQDQNAAEVYVLTTLNSLGVQLRFSAHDTKTILMPVLAYEDLARMPVEDMMCVGYKQDGDYFFTLWIPDETPSVNPVIFEDWATTSLLCLMVYFYQTHLKHRSHDIQVSYTLHEGCSEKLTMVPVSVFREIISAAILRENPIYESCGVDVRIATFYENKVVPLLDK